MKRKERRLLREEDCAALSEALSTSSFAWLLSSSFSLMNQAIWEWLISSIFRRMKVNWLRVWSAFFFSKSCGISDSFFFSIFCLKRTDRLLFADFAFFKPTTNADDWTFLNLFFTGISSKSAFLLCLKGLYSPYGLSSISAMKSSSMVVSGTWYSLEYLGEGILLAYCSLNMRWRNSGPRLWMVSFSSPERCSSFQTLCYYELRFTSLYLSSIAYVIAISK